MQDEQAHKARILTVLILSALVVMVPGGAVFAKKPPKTYPEEGKVIGVGTGQHVSPFGAFGPHTVYTHTYKIETSTKTYQLDCDEDNGCGGDKKIQIGDVIHFRLEKGWAYIPVVETTTDLSTYAKQTVSREQRLRILSEELKPNAKPTDAAPATPQGDNKPQGAGM